MVELWRESQSFVKIALIYDNGIINNNCQHVEWLFCAP